MLAVITLLAMVSFVFIPILMQSSKFSAGPANPVVVKTAKYGNLKDSDLAQLMYQHRLALNFLAQLETEAVRLKNPGQPVDIQMVNMQLGRLFGQQTEEAVVNNWIQCRRAEELGMVVTDESANQFLKLFTGGALDDATVRVILSNQHVSDRLLLNAVKDELAAFHLREMFLVSQEAVTPAQRWQYYQQLKKQATVELVAVAVDPFAAKVADPDDATLKTFFEENKERLPDPEKPEAGFRVPHEAEVQYLKADYDKFVDPKKVTQEQIKQYYEANKEQFRHTTLPSRQPEAVPKAEAAPKAETKPAADAKPAGGGAKPASEGAKPAGQGAKPAAKAAAPVKTEATKPAAPAAKSGKSSALPRTSPFRMTAYRLADTEKPAGGAAPAAKPGAPADTAKPAAKPAASTKPADVAQPAAAKPAATPPAAAKTAPAAAKVGSAAPKTEPAAPKSEKVVVEYDPLEKVQDLIRATLAGQQASEEMMSRLSPIEEEMSRYNSDRVVYEQEVKSNPSAVPPVKVDLVAMAKRNNLVLAETGFISPLTAPQHDIGKATIVGRPGTTVAKIVFGDATIFRPQFAEDTGKNRYLFWKTADYAEHVPAFSDAGIRQHVLQVWKEHKARSLALDDCRRLQAKAVESKKPLKEALKGESGLKVLEPSPFSWLSANYMPTWPPRSDVRTSAVDGVDLPGKAFMQAVFSTAEGKTAVAMNEPQTVAYVIGIDKFSPPAAVLWDEFLVDDVGTYQEVAQRDRRRMEQVWEHDLNQQAGLQWQPGHDRHRQSGGPYQPTGDLPDLDF